MLNFLTASDVANEISMSRSKFRGTYVVVEGNTDVRLYGKFLADGVEVIAASSKTNVKGTVSECLRRRDDKIIGIVDKDIDGMIGKTVKEPVFYTDRRDLECGLMCSEALEGVLAEYADKELMARFVRDNGPVRDVIGRAAAPLGVMMYISYKRGMSLSFKDLNHRFFINRKTLAVDVSRMVQEVFQQSMGQMVSVSSMAELVRDTVKKLDDPWDAVRGHDATAILAIGLTTIFGSYNSKYIDSNTVSGALRLAYSYEMFVTTRLFAESSDYARRKNLALWRITPQ
jgi:hypothetical protein